jgi:succinate-semialdehyde dehydrogenase / glutarate-semialdehyde dehydrogenase
MNATSAPPARRPNVMHRLGYIGGRWVGARNGATFAVYDPATGEVLADVPRMGTVETTEAIELAHAAWADWRSRDALSRGEILRRWAALMRERLNDLAELIVREQGKPVAEAKAEVTYAASFFDWFAEEGRRGYGDTMSSTLVGRRVFVIKQPFGVGACITPWNFPVAMVTRKAAPALAAGNTVVLKPAEQTPLSALAVCALAEEAGVPPGVFNVVTGDADDAPGIGLELTTHPRVRKVSFTGSTAVGAILMRQAAGSIKSVSLELGGNAPFIVFDDADLEIVLTAAIIAKFRNGGQTCISANRFFVARHLCAEFVEGLAERVGRLVVGNGLDPATDVGPLIDLAAVDKVRRHVANAVSAGAELVMGGSPHELGGSYFEPTVLSECAVGTDLCREETFGPVAAIFPFDDERTMLELANNTEFGLAAYLFTSDSARVWRVAEALESGMVAVNTAEFTSPVVPFGGVKQSGLGREGGHAGLDDWLESKYICLGGL